MEQSYSLRAVLEGDPSGTYLCHHGIKGQKWGVRRYQNPDGTLTEEGLKRYRQARDKYINKKGSFSTTKDTVVSSLETAGLTTGMGITAALLNPVSTPVAIASAVGIGGLTVANIIRGSIRREAARGYVEALGGQDLKVQARNDGFSSAYSTYGIPGAIGAAIKNNSRRKAMLDEKANKVIDKSTDADIWKAVGSLQSIDKMSSAKSWLKKDSGSNPKKTLQDAKRYLQFTNPAFLPPAERKKYNAVLAKLNAANVSYDKDQQAAFQSNMKQLADILKTV
jgi:hypothetical protein